MSPQIGIDLGTTNSVVAYVEGNRSETIPNSEGQKTTPSVVLLREEELVVGELAKRQLVAQPYSTVRSVKRLMGQRFSEVRSRIDDFPFRVVEGPEDKALIELEGLMVTPEEVSAAVLTKMRMTAEEYLGEDVDQAVITVPAHFNDSQRTATKKSAEIAGLEVLRIINEPTAAALAYGIDKSAEELVAVFDFGGGTFDISLLQLSKGIFEVLATNGDTQLGGDNLDQVLVQWIADEIMVETEIDPRGDIQALQRIRETAEKVKCELSSLQSTSISLPFIVSDENGPKHFNREITRETFLSLVRPILDRLVPPCRMVLKDAGLKPDRIQRVLLVGGSTRIPEVRSMVKDLFKRDPSHSINPDEAVALGAAIQCGIISGALQEVLLLDVVPLSLGIELAGGVFKPLISRNSTIPTTVTRKFTTVVDNQESVMVHVLQGERKMAKENRTLARFRLVGISPAPREVPEVQVRLHIDANGILQVSAQDLTSGTAESITVESYSSALPSSEEIERAVQDAQSHSIEDQLFVTGAHQMERIQNLQYQMDQFLKMVDTLTEEEFKSVKEGMIRLDIAARARDWSEIDTVELEFKMLRGKYSGEEKRARVKSEMSLGGKPALPPIADQSSQGDEEEPVAIAEPYDEGFALEINTEETPEGSPADASAESDSPGVEGESEAPLEEEALDVEGSKEEPEEESVDRSGGSKFTPPSWLFPKGPGSPGSSSGGKK